MGLSVSRTINAAKSVRLKAGETLLLTLRGLLIYETGRVPKTSVLLATPIEDTDWVEATARIAAWAVLHGVELDP